MPLPLALVAAFLLMLSAPVPASGGGPEALISDLPGWKSGPPDVMRYGQSYVAVRMYQKGDASVMVSVSNAAAMSEEGEGVADDDGEGSMNLPPGIHDTEGEFSAEDGGVTFRRTQVDGYWVMTMQTAGSGSVVVNYPGGAAFSCTYTLISNEAGFKLCKSFNWGAIEKALGAL
jgi:hypothetical protein